MQSIRMTLGVCVTGIIGFTFLGNLATNMAQLEPLPARLTELVVRKVRRGC
jgi:hypothetical protein